LASNLGETARAIKEIRSEPVAVITNGSLFMTLALGKNWL